MESKVENMFGKQRGRFDEVQAKYMQRDLIDTLIATWRAIPPVLQETAITRFNESMKPDKSLDGFMIIKVK